MTTPTDPQAFDEALNRVAKSDEVIRDTYCDSAFTARNAFEKGARWARAWVLANDPVVEVEKALRALLRVRSEETIAIAECALNDLEDARGTK